MPTSKKFELSPSLAILISGVVVAGAIVYVNQHPAAATQAAAAAAPTAIVKDVSAPTAQDHIIGSPDAPIVLIEYSDFQCPYCQVIYPEIKDIVSKSNGQVAWVMRNFPLSSIHPQANPAANAAECIAAQLGNDAFWKYADAVFGSQSNLSPDYSSQLAAQFGADMTKYNACITASTYQSKIDGTTAEAQAAGGQGTPFTVVLNTKTGKQTPISGAVPEAQIQAIIDSSK